MRVLGVDPGLSRCGVGVVEGSSRRAVAVCAGVIRTPPGDPTPARLQTLHTALVALVADRAPHVVAVERVFFNSNARTAIGVAQAAGIALLVAQSAGLPVIEYTPTQVKAAVAGTGDADKEQVGFMVRTLLRLREAPRPADAADALALALCHLHSGGPREGGVMSARLAAAVAVSQPGAQTVGGRR